VNITPGPVADIGPLYDFETIFRDPEQAEFFASARQTGLEEYLPSLESTVDEYTAPLSTGINPYGDYDFTSQKASDNDILQKLLSIIKGTT